ncbi:MAG TPA: Maf family protein [Thermohalobaculum sp.]|nr:Maf family protein [Thermohalobaculum sp.]
MSALVLASASPARKAMLEAAGVAAEVEPARVDEAAVKAALRAEGASARDQADALAELKALRVSARRPGWMVLGADQVLELEGEVLDKPADRREARAQLERLSGRRHRLLSAAVIAEDGQPVWRHVGRAELEMRPLGPGFIDGYLDRVGQAALCSVGAYQVEGLGVQLFARIGGDWFTVLGLPLLEVLAFLRQRGMLDA